MAMDTHRSRALLILFAAAVVAAGLLILLVEANPAWTADRSFEPAPNSPFPVGSTPTTVTNADFNGDGKMDLAAQNAGSNNVSVLLGGGDGNFQPAPNSPFQVGSNPSSVTSADFNGDKKADLAVTNQSSHNLSVLLGNGDGNFQAASNSPFAVGGQSWAEPSSVISAHFNGDGKADLAVANLESHDVSVLLGNGDGNFQVAKNFTMGSNPNQVISADFNSDGKADLATANWGRCYPLPSCTTLDVAGGFSVRFGNGDGTFQPSRTTELEHTYSITTGDFNSDGKADLVVPLYRSKSIWVMLGIGDGTFQSVRTITWDTNPVAVTSADFDSDSRADLAVTNFTSASSDNVSILFGDGNGGFQAPQNLPTGDGPVFVIGANLNANSSADLAVANQDSHNVSVLLNTESQPPPPETTITDGPSEGQEVNITSATFGFTSSESGSTFQCSLDNPDDAAYSPCTSPKTVPDVGQNLAEGWHTFYVKATGSGGTDPTPATRTWKVDTIAPATPVMSSPPEGGRVGSSFTVSGTAEPDSTVQLSEGTASKGSATASSTGNWSIVLSGITEGSHTYKAKATDKAGNASAESNPRAVTVDTTSPTVVGTTPPNLATGVGRGISPTVTFSEKMTARTIKATTFKLFKVNPDKSTTQITDVVVSLSSDGLTAKLNPFGTTTTVLASNTKYKAVVTTGAKDLAGNSLAQQKSWTFTTKP